MHALLRLGKKESTRSFYINDLPSVVFKGNSIARYADDSKLYMIRLFTLFMIKSASAGPK